ncbi:MAG: RDD family protein [Candidatus Dormiibacterota bacterium]
MTAGGPPLPPPQAPGQWDGGQAPPAPPPMYPAAAPMYPATPYYPNLHPGPAPGIGYAGFWIRFVATIIDSIIVVVPIAILFFVLESSAISTYVNCVNSATASGSLAITCQGLFPSSSITYFELISLGVELLYFVILWSQFGGTLGQRMLGLHVVDAATGRNIGVGRAIGRFVGYIISAVPLYIGLIWVAFDPRKQGWHDKIASTFVVRKV